MMNRRASLDEIIDGTARLLNVDATHIAAGPPKADRWTTFARQLAVLVAHEYGYGLKEIQAAMGGGAHTTALYRARTAREKINSMDVI